MIQLEIHQFDPQITNLKTDSRAHWLTREQIAWPLDQNDIESFLLHFDTSGTLQISNQGVMRATTIHLHLESKELDKALADRFPHIPEAYILKIPSDALEMVPTILKSHVVISAKNEQGKIIDLTGLQISGVLDHCYANEQKLGIFWQGNMPILRVWAPTAKAVRFHLFDEPPKNRIPENVANHQVFPMDWDPNTGNWTITGNPGWNNKYYLYEVDVFVREQGRIVTNWVTDPYSLSLSTNSRSSQIVNLRDPALFPQNWEETRPTPLKDPVKAIIYELHLRDFSIRDQSLPKKLRGTYHAFSYPQSSGVKHLQWLCDQGITHIHLLPVFDFATVNEVQDEWAPLDWELLQSLPPDSEEQQEILQDIQDMDGYNWGYDPFHFTVPEGSYSQFSDGNSRILEFRKMVQSIHAMGLRVVMDVVYNHTHANGQDRYAVLDKIVPGYYHRLDLFGDVTTSTCCPNTATEHTMMRKLMLDSIITWVLEYRIDGFRFDLMGHHMKSDIIRLRNLLNQLTLEDHGVDGNEILIYGEGWDFGEVASNARGVNASQRNMAGTGIGTFNDRLRDAVRGGGPFIDPTTQGYATGLYLTPNSHDDSPSEETLTRLIKVKDIIRLSLAGNLADYRLVNYLGETVPGNEIRANADPAGYTKNPQENIAYISAHDNETLFDALQYKLPRTTSLLDRVKIQNLALSLVTFSQGIPFYHAGCEILRSKSMDRDSYNSTDWFNAIDWEYKDNNWGHGLPPKTHNADRWPIIRPLLSDPDLAPSPEHIQMSREIFGLYLRIRRSSPLFTLKTASQINELVHFHNTGPDQVPGLIVMSIIDQQSQMLDPNRQLIFVIFNASPNREAFQLNQWRVEKLHLHPFLQDSALIPAASFCQIKQSFDLPSYSTTVFVSPDFPILNHQ